MDGPDIGFTTIIEAGAFVVQYKKARMEDPDAPATKRDIADVKAELTSQNEQLRSEMNHIYNDLVERIADSETKLLKAFYNYAESNQQRLAQR